MQWGRAGTSSSVQGIPGGEANALEGASAENIGNFAWDWEPAERCGSHGLLRQFKRAVLQQLRGLTHLILALMEVIQPYRCSARQVPLFRNRRAESIRIL